MTFSKRSLSIEKITICLGIESFGRLCPIPSQKLWGVLLGAVPGPDSVLRGSLYLETGMATQPAR
jgi:hypothetical protein